VTAPIDFLWGPRTDAQATRFRLWAPDRDDVALEIAGAPPMKMRHTKDGWREALSPAPPGTQYNFRIGDIAVPDPASRAQGGMASIVTDPTGFVWRNTQWNGRAWEETILYEVHPGLMGGFKGVADKLEALAEIGITAIELMPVADFPGARNWGYDGTLPFAPDEQYGTPDDFKRLIDAAHGLGLMIFLDVVYNHFGPDGNYLGLYAREFFRADCRTPWGDAIDFRRQPVRRFFIENALYWIHEFRIDGLRFDAVHAICGKDFLHELAREIRASVPPERHVHLVVENDDNDAGLLENGFDAQWNDDFHHAMHVLLTGETTGYYGDYAQHPAEALARSLRDGFVYQGEYSQHRGTARGTASAHLPPTAFVDFLQNHDQTGNRAFGERLTALAGPKALRAAVALLLLSPHIPLLFMGEEWGAREPFLYFCDHRDADLAKSVREGRRSEFAKFADFADPSKRAQIPDPNAAETFERSRPRDDAAEARLWRYLYTRLLRLRHEQIIPRLKGADGEHAEAIGEKAILAHWRMGDGARLTLACNLGSEAAPANLPGGVPLWGQTGGGTIQAHTTLCWIELP
jgi:maltooligosyltrehalose trehalohydrolase